MGGLLLVYAFITWSATFYALRLFTKGEWVVKKGKNFVYVIIEWPLSAVPTLRCPRKAETS